MSKKQSNMTKYILCILSIMVAFLMVFNFIPQKTVNAEGIDLSDDNHVIEKGSGLYKISSELYDALIDAYNSANPSNPTSELKIGTFKNMTALDLSNKGISDFTGLYYFKFNSLVQLNLSNNSLTGNFKGFEFFNSLKVLNLSNNNLTGFENDFSSLLENIDLSNNSLTTAKLGTLAENAVVNLSYNQLKTFEKITFPQTACSVHLTHNFLTEDINLANYENLTLYLGLQGVNQNANLIKQDKIKFGVLDNVEKLELYKKVGENYVLVQDINPNSELTNLNINAYKITFVLVDTTSTNYDDILFMVRPKMPNYKLVDEEQNKLETTSTILKQKCEIIFEGDGELYYQVNNGEIVKGTSFKIEESGSYTISFWQKQDGVDSLKNSITIISKYFNPLSFVWIMLGIVFFVAMFYAGIVWKNSFSKSKNTKSSNLSGKGFN